MKKAIFAAAIAGAFAASAAVKTATVDMLLLVRSHANYETNKALLTGMEKDYRKNLDSMGEELEKIQEEGRKLAEQLKNPMLSAAAKEKAEKDITAVQQRYITLQQNMRKEAMQNQKTLADMESRLIKSQTDELKKKVAEFAKKNGYDIILDSSIAVYADKELDVTDEVLDFMGIDAKAARAKDKEKNEGK